MVILGKENGKCKGRRSLHMPPTPQRRLHLRGGRGEREGSSGRLDHPSLTPSQALQGNKGRLLVKW